MMEFLKGLDTVQIVMLVAGVFLLWPTVKEKLVGMAQPTNVVEEEEVLPDYDLTDLVRKWETLCDACDERGLTQACAKLSEVFPMLAKDYGHHDT